MRSSDIEVAVVTGAASGIGLALVRRFVADGCAVVMADVDPALLDVESTALAAAGARVLAVPTDVTDPVAVEALADAAFDGFGTVDVVCNNAGTMASGPMWEIPLEDWHRVIDVNLWGVVHGIRTFVPRLIAAGEPAHIVNTASMAGLASLPMIAPYVASKQAVVGMSEALSHELRSVGASIDVSVLCPGYVPSRLGREPGAVIEAPAPGELSADDVAAAVLDAIVDGRFYVLTHPGSAELFAARAAAIADAREAFVMGRPR